MRSILFALALALSVSSRALAQQYATVAPEAESSRAKSANSYLERGNTWFKKGEFERAIADYSLAIAFDAGFAGSYCNIEIAPRDARAWTNRGAARQELGDFDASLADYAEAIRLNSRLADPWRNRCGAHYLRGERKETGA